MSCVSYLVFFFISHLLLVSLGREEKGSGPKCHPFHCGDLRHLPFPFYNGTDPECGFLRVYHCKEKFPRIQLGKDGQIFYVSTITEDDTEPDTHTLTLQDRPGLEKPPLCNHSFVESLRNFTIPSPPFVSFEVLQPNNQTMLKCPASAPSSLLVNYTLACNDSKHSIIFYNVSNHHHGPSTVPSHCSRIPFKMNNTQNGFDFSNFYTGWFQLQVNVTKECRDCHSHRGGECQIDHHGKFHCRNARTDAKILNLGVGIGFGIGGSTVVIVVPLIWFIRRRKKQKHVSFNSRFISSDPFSRSEQEVGSVCFRVPVFSYKELAEATNNFSHEKELGDGGFGRVYYG